MQPQTDTRSTRGKKPRDEQNGHKIILKAIINKKQRLVIELLNGRVVKGLVSQFDNYTVTILEEFNIGGDTRPRTFFKHAILSFYAE
ncbi:RNA-binding protein Hfq [compost metagenome]